MGYPTDLILSNRRKSSPESNSSSNSQETDLHKLLTTFCARNSIHGINNLLRESSSIYERVVWFLGLTLTIIGMFYVSLIISHRYAENKFQTVVDTTTYPIYEIPFPTITICNNNRLNWKRLEQAKFKFLSRYASKEKQDLFDRFIATFDGITFGQFALFENISNYPLEILNNVNFTNVFAFMTWTCEEILSNCRWLGKKFNCCELFSRQKSELGPCYSFNGIQSKETIRKAKVDQYYPLHTSNYGPKSGLEVRVAIRPEDHVPDSPLDKGVMVMVHEQLVWQRPGLFIHWNTETSIEVDPVIFFYDKRTRGQSSKLRKCVFDYRERKFQTVVDSTTYPIYEILFPTITICNGNRLNWRLLEAAKNKFLLGENDTYKLEIFAKFIACLDETDFGKFDLFESVKDDPLKILNDVNFTNVFAFMTWTCEEMFEDCKWRNEKFDCCDMFHPSKSEHGLCYTFNGIQGETSKNKANKDPFYPLHNSDYGPGSALKVKVLIRPADHVPNSIQDKGFIVMIHELLVWQSDSFFVPWNTETSIEVDPVIYFHDNSTRGLSSNLSQFVDDDERNSDDFKSIPGYVYMIENCFSQCHQEHLMRYCNCTLDLLYPPGDFPPCQASDFQCIYHHREDFRHTKRKGEENYVFNEHEGMTCKCFRNCYSLNYIPEVRPSYLPPNILSNLSYVDLDVHYRFDSFMVYRTSLVFGWVDLMVSFGGIAGLFLGCSLISGVEILYFLGVDIPKFVYRRLRDNWKQREPKVVNSYHNHQHHRYAGGVTGGKYAGYKNRRIFGVKNVFKSNFK